MSYCALWLDHQHATLFTFSQKDGALDMASVSAESITADEPIEHHNRHPHDVVYNVKQQALDGFFGKITQKLKHVNQLLVMGPGIAKSQFIHHCETLSNKDIFNAIVGFETIGSYATNNEMLTNAESFFCSHP